MPTIRHNNINYKSSRTGLLRLSKHASSPSLLQPWQQLLVQLLWLVVLRAVPHPLQQRKLRVRPAAAQLQEVPAAQQNTTCIRLKRLVQDKPAAPCFAAAPVIKRYTIQESRSYLHSACQATRSPSKALKNAQHQHCYVTAAVTLPPTCQLGHQWV